MNHPRVHHVGLVLLAVLPPLAAASPAAVDARIGLSRDGVSWSEQLSAPLFDRTIRWVPGDVRTEAFFVRNESSDPAALSVDVLGTRVDSLLETGDLVVTARGGGTEWRSTDEPGTHRLVSMVDVDPSDRTRVEVTVAFDPASTNVSQRRELDLDLRVHLQQTGAGAPSAADDPGGLLPDTGGPTHWTILAGIALLALGLAVTSTRRQEAGTHA